jgi:hypothetical protein
MIDDKMRIDSKLPIPEKEYYTLPKAAEFLGVSEHTLRIALKKGLIRSKRTSKAARARFMFHVDWLDEYKRYQDSPTLSMRVKVWFRKHF